MEPNTITILFLGDDKIGKSTFLSYVCPAGQSRKADLTLCTYEEKRRVSQGRESLAGKVSKPLLRDLDQPFVFELRSRKAAFRLEFYDTASPDNWRLLRPDLVVLGYDISQRLSLLNLQRVVRRAPMFPCSPAPLFKTKAHSLIRSEVDQRGQDDHPGQ